MKFRMLLCASLLVFFTVSFSGCKDDDEATPKLELKVDGQIYSLKDAQIFFVREGGTEGQVSFMYKQYVITDGEIVSGYGFSKDDYEDATYFLIVQIGVPVSGEWSTGEFPQYRNWGGAPAGSNVSYVASNFFEDADYYFTSPQTEHNPIIVSGGLEPANKISFEYDGNIQFERADATGESWLVTDEPCKIRFTGKIIDGRITGV